MRRAPLTLAPLVALVCLLRPAAAAGPTPFERAQLRSQRVREAYAHHAQELEHAFHDAGAAWPPRAVYLRAMKFESELELWAAPAAHAERVLVRTFHICAKSGGLGPKARDGDGQVPEGFYVLEGFNHGGEHHLALGVSYPNAVDRARAGANPPGGDIFIHGGCVTVGCLPIEDDPIEALFVVAVSARGHGQTRIPLHIFPCRFDSDACANARREAAPAPDTRALWRVLEGAYLRFEKTHLPPVAQPTARGYLLAPVP